MSDTEIERAVIRSTLAQHRRAGYMDNCRCGWQCPRAGFIREYLNHVSDAVAEALEGARS